MTIEKSLRNSAVGKHNKITHNLNTQSQIQTFWYIYFQSFFPMYRSQNTVFNKGKS